MRKDTFLYRHTFVFLGLSLSHCQATRFGRKQVTSGEPLFSGFEREVVKHLSLHPHPYQLPVFEELKCFIYVYCVPLHELEHRSSHIHMDTHLHATKYTPRHKHSVIHKLLRTVAHSPHHLPQSPLPHACIKADKARRDPILFGCKWPLNLTNLRIIPALNGFDCLFSARSLGLGLGRLASSPSSTCNVHEESPQLCGSFM